MPDIRLAGLWPLLRARLDSDPLALALGGRDHLYLPPGPLYPERTEAEAGVAWGRVVILPMATLWPPEGDIPGEARPLAFLARTEFNDVDAEEVEYGVEAAHSEILRLLDGWLAGSWVGGTMVQPVWREVPPLPVSLYDSSRAVWVNPAEYRCYVAPGDVP